MCIILSPLRMPRCQKVLVERDATPIDTPAEPLELSHQRGRIQSSERPKTPRHQEKSRDPKKSVATALGLWDCGKMDQTQRHLTRLMSCALLIGSHDLWDPYDVGNFHKICVMKYIKSTSNWAWYCLMPTVISIYFYNILWYQWYHLISYLGRDYWLLTSSLRLIAPEEQCQVAAYPGRPEADPHLVRGKLGVKAGGPAEDLQKGSTLTHSPVLLRNVKCELFTHQTSQNPRGSCLTPAL